MMIIRELENCLRISYEKASPKERLFYDFVTYGNSSIEDIGSSPTDIICIDAFKYRATSSEALNSLQKTKPLKNIHYANNLVDLIAASLIDPVGEKSHIEQYIQMHGLRESYLFRLSANCESLLSGNIRTDMDRLIELIEVKNDTTESVPLFNKVFSDSTHIFDLLVLKRLYTKYLSIHPDAHNLKKYSEMESVVRLLAVRINRIVLLVISFPLVYLLFQYAIWYFNNREFHDELVQVLGHIVGIAVFAFFIIGINIPSKTRLLRSIRTYILSLGYRIFGLNYVQIRKFLPKEEKDESD